MNKITFKHKKNHAKRKNVIYDKPNILSRKNIFLITHTFESNLFFGKFPPYI